MPQSKEQKSKNAKILIEKRATRTPQEQLALLDEKFGVNVGAKKERERLKKQIK